MNAFWMLVFAVAMFAIAYYALIFDMLNTSSWWRLLVFAISAALGVCALILAIGNILSI